MIDAARLKDIFVDCLYKDDELIDGKPIVPPIIVEGITAGFGFYPARIEEYKDEIIEMLSQLHPTFYKGWSFLNLCVDKDGVLWGEHPSCERLMVLGMAIDKVGYCMPRDMWDALPAKMPYIILFK